MKSFLLHILTVTAICLLLHNCKHEPIIDPNGPQCGEATTIDEMKNWYFFKAGSFWVYEELSTGALDTVTVYFDEEGVTTDGFPFWTMKTYSTFYDYDFNYRYNDSFTVGCLNGEGCNCKKVNRSKTRPGAPTVNETPFHIPHIVSSYENLITGGTSTLQENFDSLIVNDVVYYNVVKWNLSSSVTEKINPSNWDDGTEANFYVSEHKWIIKKEVPEYNQVWILIELFNIQ